MSSLSRTEIGSTECKEATSIVRKKLHDSAYGSKSKDALKEWSKVSSSNLIAESSGFIPFRTNILKEWNIVDDDDDDDDDDIHTDTVAAANDREGVKILVRFPSSLLPAELEENGTILEYSGCLEVDFDKIDLRTFAPDVPMLIQFHAGAMIMGGCHDSWLIDEATRLVQNAPKQNTPSDLITVSVEYGLAPENPFPIGIMDGLSVIDYLLNDNDTTNTTTTTNARKAVHISGISAGANVSLVTGLESFRRFPGKILSIHAQSPFLNPAGDTMSYYMNKNVSPSTQFLRWSWQAYLGLEQQTQKQTPSDDDSNSDNGIDNDNDNETQLEKVLRKDSNYSSWNKWKADHPSKAIQRLVNPALDVPDGLNIMSCNDDGTKNAAPKIILRYNMGDPLMDDGKDIVDALKTANANASYFKEMGLHCKQAYNADAPNENWKIWSEAVFGG